MRLFVAVQLSETVRAELKRTQSKLGPVCPGVRWVQPELLHLTLKFLGEVDDRDVNEVAAALAEAARECKRFTMLIRGAGCFPPKDRVRVVWVGAEDDSRSLARVAATVDRAMGDLGFEPERRPFSPHITIGRVRSDRSGGGVRNEVGRTAVKHKEQAVDSIALMSSVLSAAGPEYAPVATVALA